MENKRLGKIIFLIVALGAIVAFLLISNSLVKDLAKQERERMHIWAQATERLAKAEDTSDLEFLLSIISENNSIPVLVADEEMHISQFRNFDLPEPVHADTYSYEQLSQRNRAYLDGVLRHAAAGKTLREQSADNAHFIQVEMFADTYIYIYFEDSTTLKRLSYYPYVQLLAMIIFVAVLYWALVYTKRAEQNRVWVGLSKETAHQLGTPISSLMAWNEYLSAAEDDPDAIKEAVVEMDKDVRRLSVIADRFSKIGSVPELSLQYLNHAIETSLEYMRSRISGKVEIKMDFPPDDIAVRLSLPLFEWVMENLTKNAVDAMEGAGIISITTGEEKGRVFVEISDTGKGIARKNFKTVFNPGYTTKKRGWGLGLTLVKRIIEEYHKGKIFVKRSDLGRGTTFRIELEG
jgi:K+-sensing histidine kinase KdpD